MDNKEAAIQPAAAQPHVSASPVGDGSTVRRRLFTAGAAGAAMSLLPWLGGRASATTPPDDSAPIDSDGDDFNPDTTSAVDVTTGGTQDSTPLTDPEQEDAVTQPPTGDTTSGGEPEAAPTTTEAPERRPTPEDLELLDFAQSVELTIRDLYDVAIEAGVFADELALDIVAIRESHEGYATSVAGAIGRNAGNRRNDALFDELSGDFEGDVATVAAAAAQLEDVAVATHIDVIGQLVGTDAASLIASVVVIESRNATVLRAISGVEDLAGLLQSDAEALSPTDYPVE